MRGFWLERGATPLRVADRGASSRTDGVRGQRLGRVCPLSEIDLWLHHPIWKALAEDVVDDPADYSTVVGRGRVLCLRRGGDPRHWHQIDALRVGCGGERGGVAHRLVGGGEVVCVPKRGRQAPPHRQQGAVGAGSSEAREGPAEESSRGDQPSGPPHEVIDLRRLESLRSSIGVEIGSRPDEQADAEGKSW